jgi:hypothetical protein
MPERAERKLKLGMGRHSLGFGIRLGPESEGQLWFFTKRHEQKTSEKREGVSEGREIGPGLENNVPTNIFSKETYRTAE